MTEQIAAINDCKYLFLAQIQELGRRGLRLVVEEGRPAEHADPLDVGGVIISGATRIEVTPASSVFEVIWNSYVAYSVINESFAAAPIANQIFEGSRFRVYRKSHFIDYVSRASFATTVYPGPMQHYEACREDHIVDVISISAPQVERRFSESHSIEQRAFRM